METKDPLNTDWLNNTGLDQLIAQTVALLVSTIEHKNIINNQKLETVTYQQGNYYVHLQHVNFDEDTAILKDK